MVANRMSGCGNFETNIYREFDRYNINEKERGLTL